MPRCAATTHEYRYLSLDSLLNAMYDETVYFTCSVVPFDVRYTLHNAAKESKGQP